MYNIYKEMKHKMTILMHFVANNMNNAACNHKIPQNASMVITKDKIYSLAKSVNYAKIRIYLYERTSVVE